MNDTTLFQQNTPAWLFFAKASFALSVLATGVGIFFLPAAVWVKGYLAMGMLYTVGSTFMPRRRATCS